MQFQFLWLSNMFNFSPIRRTILHFLGSGHVQVQQIGHVIWPLLKSNLLIEVLANSSQTDHLAFLGTPDTPNSLHTRPGMQFNFFWNPDMFNFCQTQGGDGGWAKKEKIFCFWYPAHLKKPSPGRMLGPNDSGWATPWADFAAITDQLWSTITAIFPCVALSWKTCSLLWIFVNYYQPKKRPTICIWVQVLENLVISTPNIDFWYQLNCSSESYNHSLFPSPRPDMQFYFYWHLFCPICFCTILTFSAKSRFFLPFFFEMLFLCLHPLVFRRPKDCKTPQKHPSFTQFGSRHLSLDPPILKKNVFFWRFREVVADAIAAHKQASQMPKHSQTARKTDLKNRIPHFGSRWRAVAAGIKPFAAARPANQTCQLLSSLFVTSWGPHLGQKKFRGRAALERFCAKLPRAHRIGLEEWR